MHTYTKAWLCFSKSPGAPRRSTVFRASAPEGSGGRGLLIYGLDWQSAPTSAPGPALSNQCTYTETPVLQSEGNQPLVLSVHLAAGAPTSKYRMKINVL